jgi:hypothetical protein
MDVKASTMVAVLLAALCMVANAMNLPAADQSNELEMGPEKNELDERATWLDTRDLEDDFTELVYSAIQELANEKRITDVITEKTKTKRGRWQGFCFRRTRNGRFLPYICWKGDRK